MSIDAESAVRRYVQVVSPATLTFVRAACGVACGLVTAVQANASCEFFVTHVTNKNGGRLLAKETLEQVEELLDELREFSSDGVPILVEGANDERALRKLNVKAKIFRISGGSKTLLNFLENLTGFEQIIILTDFDRAGDKLAKFCAEHLRRLGVKPIADIREKLKALLRKDVKDIQGLAGFLHCQPLVPPGIKTDLFTE